MSDINIPALRNILFNQLKRLDNENITSEDLDKEAYRTSQMVMISNELIKSGSIEIEFLRLKESIKGNSGFFPIEEVKSLE